MKSLDEFLNSTSYNEVLAMRNAHAIPAWDSAHPHGMMITGGEGPYLLGEIQNPDGTTKKIKAVDGHGHILCNSAGYGHPEVEDARARVRKDKVDTVSNNFHHPVVEWTRGVLLESLPPEWQKKYKVLFVASGTEANDALRRVALAQGNGQAEFVNLRRGYSGAGYAANAACGNPPWKGNSTPDLPGMHFVDPTDESLKKVLFDIPQGRSVAGMSEAGTFGVGGFLEIPDAFLRTFAEEVRKRLAELYLDEVQTGLGRTGTTFWASERIMRGMEPPGGMSVAKGAGGNHRFALAFVREDVAAKVKGLTYHTFGQTIEDLAAAGTVVQIAQRDGWVQNAAARGAQLTEGFNTTVKTASRVPFSTHGRGLLFGVQLDTAALVNAVLRRAPHDGWVCGKGGVKGNILRIAPPINTSEEVIKELIAGAEKTFASEEVEKAAAA